VQGVLERASIKLASVATDMMGVSGGAILAALVEGRADPATMAELAKRRLRRGLSTPNNATSLVSCASIRSSLAMMTDGSGISP
jgi:hypothetical protein